MRAGFLRGVALAALLLAGLPPARAQELPNLLPRYPNAGNGKIVFVAAGNLWQVDAAGGRAERLTSDGGQDMMPHVSPDGKWIAYTANYQGNVDVYLIPASGGPARRLTFQSDVYAKTGGRHGSNNLVLGWTPDSQNVVFLSRRMAWNDWISRLFTVPIGGGQPIPMKLDSGGMLSFSPDGKSIAYNRIFRNFRTWKRYTGGLAQQIFTYNFDSGQLTQITDWKGTNTAPMWVGRKIYFLSDRDHNFRANIWVTDLDSKETRQITHFTDFDIDFPSLANDNRSITFQQGGALWAIDLPGETLRKVAVTIPDDGRRTMRRAVNAADRLRDQDMAQIVDYALSPNGKRALFSARGDIFSLPAEDGPTRNLTMSDGADEDHPTFSPDGKMIAYTTDSSGSMQIAIRPAAGGAEQQLTHFRSGYFYQPVFSPDGKQLAFSDTLHRVWVVPASGGEPRMAGQSHHFGEVHDYSFSPDSRYLAFSIGRDAQMHDIAIFDTKTGKTMIAADELNDNFNPRFSDDGKYLYFLSNRRENPTVADNEFNLINLKSISIFAAPLTAAIPSPFAPRSDEAAADAGGDKPKDAGAKDKGDHAPPAVTIELAGLMSRAVAVPVATANITSLDLRDGRIFYQTQPLQTLDGPLAGEKPALHVYDIAKRKDEVVTEGLDSYTLSGDGKRVLIKEAKAYSIIDASADGGKDPDKRKALKLETMQAWVQPRHEWAEMFENAWRLERDLYVIPSMNGADWQRVHDQYARFLPLLGSREDLNYVIGQVLGEIGNSHTYVDDGDDGDLTPEIRTGQLGADFALDEASGRYRFAKIYAGDNTRAAYRAPLSVPGNVVHEGEYLLAVNGVDLKAPDSPDAAMSGLAAGTQVTLSVAASPGGKRRDVVVMPVRSELPLREKDWIDHNRALVDKLSGGRIGYIYLSDMNLIGMQQFFRQFYGQLGKQAMVIDDRWNGGGFIDQVVLERLRRVLVGMTTNRLGDGFTIPQQTLVGPMACLLNHFSASDGDIFPYYFHKYHLGPLIGTRSWGGVRGIRGEWNLLDGGTITIPEDSIYDTDSQWAVENHGVDPDIVVENEPRDLMAGRDAQLETAVHLLMDKLEDRTSTWPAPPPASPPYPKAGIVPPPQF